MRILMKLAFASVLALAAIALPGASSNAAMVNTLPAIDSVAGQKPLLHEVKKKKYLWLKKKKGNWSNKWAYKQHSKKWSSPKKTHWRKRRRRHYYRRPGIYFRFYPRYYYYDDYYDDDYYYRSSCGTYAEKKRCARKYRSFNWDTCRYTTYSGRKRLCPYVR